MEIAQRETEGVGHDLAIIESSRCLHQRDAGLPANLSAREVGVPLREIFHRRVDATVADHVELRLTDPEGRSTRLIAERALRDERGVVIAELRVRHAERPEDALGGEVA